MASWLEVYVSNALAYEYEDILSRKLSEQRWQRLKPLLGTLLSRAHFTIIYYSWRPTSPDLGDEHVIDCAMNANAIVITYNTRDFQNARESLDLRVMTPVKLVLKLASEKIQRRIKHESSNATFTRNTPSTIGPFS